MRSAGALILFSALFLPWYTLQPDKPLSDFGVETAWEHSVILASTLTVLALLALRFRAAAAVAAVIVAGALIFAPADDVRRDAAPWLALLGALVAALEDPKWVCRLGVAALLASLLAPWYEAGAFIIIRDTEIPSLVGGFGSGPSIVTKIAIVALAVLALLRPRLAWLAIGVVVFRIIEPNPGIAYGAEVALVGSILAWSGGVLADRPPKITDRCSPATRSSTSPASPASS